MVDSGKKWTVRVDNKMRKWRGKTDHAKRVITINKKASKQLPHGVLDTEVHELLHVAHPKMKETEVYNATRHELKKLSKKSKRKIYRRFSK